MNIIDVIKINLKKKIIIASAMLPLVIGCVVILAVIPTINDIKEIKNDIESQRLDLETKYKRGQSLKKLTEDLKIIEPQLSKLDQMFINKEQVLEFVTSMEDIASANNVSQKINLASLDGESGGTYKKAPLQIITNGTFSNQLNYLINLESLSYYINVKSLEVTAGSVSANTEDSAGERSVNLLIFADIYWQ